MKVATCVLILIISAAIAYPLEDEVKPQSEVAARETIKSHSAQLPERKEEESKPGETRKTRSPDFEMKMLAAEPCCLDDEIHEEVHYHNVDNQKRQMASEEKKEIEA